MDATPLPEIVTRAPASGAPPESATIPESTAVSIARADITAAARTTVRDEKPPVSLAARRGMSIKTSCDAARTGRPPRTSPSLGQGLGTLIDPKAAPVNRVASARWRGRGVDTAGAGILGSAPPDGGGLNAAPLQEPEADR